jgi:peptidoglycan/LPS O-acetylase OafA/YrhL
MDASSSIGRRAHPVSERQGIFRPDIEGLRAIAVVEVLLFHFGVGALRGGFVGVDVFFVISGYLLTSITLAEVDAGRFSFAAFFERRLRRIYPVLLVVCLVVAAVGLFVILPNDLRDFGNGAMAAAIFVSNIVFWRIATDYFDAANIDVQPLLHTWSLAVEAQFYVLLPLFCLAMRGRGAAWRRGLTASIWLVSFGVGLWQVRYSPAAGFFLLPGRAWELLTGSLVALGALPAMRSARINSALSACGLTMIVAAGFVFSRRTPFPGASALVPVLGAALVIHGGGAGTLAARFLSLAPLRFLGRISYSLYLWHWPLVCLLHYRWGEPSSPGEPLALLAASLALATLSWFVIEQPFLKKAVLAQRPHLLAGAAAGLAAVGAVGLTAVLAGEGKVTLVALPAPVVALANGQYDRVDGECWPADVEARQWPCRFGSPLREPSVLLWGDSYARMWLVGLDDLARRHDTAGLAALFIQCPPVLGVADTGRARCPAFDEAVDRALVDRPGLRTVVLAAQWVDNPWLAEGLERLIARLATAGKTIFLVRNPPQPGYNVPRVLALAALRGDPPPPPLAQDEQVARHKAVDEIFEALRRKYAFTIVDPTTALCAEGVCPVVADGRSLYFDPDHVSGFAARRAAGIFEPVFAR